MGAWSMETTLSTWSSPSTRSHSPTGAVALYSFARAAGSRVSTTRLDLPLPLTPVTHVNSPSGTSAVTSRRLCARAPTTRTQDRPRALRLLGTGSWRLPFSHGPVIDLGFALI